MSKFYMDFYFTYHSGILFPFFFSIGFISFVCLVSILFFYQILFIYSLGFFSILLVSILLVSILLGSTLSFSTLLFQFYWFLFSFLDSACSQMYRISFNIFVSYIHTQLIISGKEHFYIVLKTLPIALETANWPLTRQVPQ